MCHLIRNRPVSALALGYGLALLALAPILAFGDAAHSNETAVWTQRKISFVYMGMTTHYSCEGLRENVRSVLLQLGARPQDLRVKEYGCTRGMGRPEPFPGVDATFFVLAPPGAKNAAGLPLDVSWQSVELKLSTNNLEQAGQCELLEQIQQRILPLFATRNLEFQEDCIPHQLTPGGTRLRVQVLKPLQKQPSG
jgi:hypothetical protein